MGFLAPFSLHRCEFWVGRCRTSLSTEVKKLAEVTNTCPTCGQRLPENLPLRVDLEVNVAVANGVAVAFTGKQAELLSLLAEARGRTLDKAYIMATMYSMDDEVAEKILDVMICKMRPRLKELGVSVVTVWSKGFRLMNKAA